MFALASGYFSHSV